MPYCSVAGCNRGAALLVKSRRTAYQTYRCSEHTSGEHAPLTDRTTVAHGVPGARAW